MKDKIFPKRTVHAVALFAVAATLAGCAAPARVDQMRSTPSMQLRMNNSNIPLKGQVAIKEVTGGQETNPMWTSEVSSADFERALELSLADAGLGALRQTGKYQLIADLQNLDQPLLGINFTVTAKVRYQLIERKRNITVAERAISSPYTATISDSFLGVERLKLANEGAVKSNIRQLIEWLYSLRVEDLAR